MTPDEKAAVEPWDNDELHSKHAKIPRALVCVLCAREGLHALEAENAALKAVVAACEDRIGEGILTVLRRERKRAEKAEARVAELETEVKKEHDRAEYNAWCVVKNIETGWGGGREPGAKA